MFKGMFKGLFKQVLSVLCALGLVACVMSPNGVVRESYQVATTKAYADVLAELEVAISEHNFRVTGHSRVGKVIRDRGTADFPEYDTVQFCNLTLAKSVLLLSPHAVEYMPCNVVTYQFEGKTIVKTHLLPTTSDNSELNQFMTQMNASLKQIVDFAAEE